MLPGSLNVHAARQTGYPQQSGTCWQAAAGRRDRGDCCAMWPAGI
uniref:Uncharacterized protein n=1 Tax=Faecalibaculum rodentium TaxID=1702221 RepID=A0A140DSF0_9FIRM|nr:hypothetical protein AALO17_04430 [Faecalibaculum rodentium]